MSTPRSAATDHPSRSGDGWQASRPELVIAVILVISVATAAYAWAGIAAAVLALTWSALLALGLLRTLSPSDPGPAPQADEWQDVIRTTIAGFWRKRGMVKDATAIMASYEHELRPTMQHLLAARLAERHGISLYADPQTARRMLLPRPRDQHLWRWVDPLQAPKPGQGPGIPPRTLAAILDRLEHL